MRRKLLLILSLLLGFSLLIFSATACSWFGDQTTEEPPEEPVKSLSFTQSVYNVDRYGMLTLVPNYNGEQTITWSSSDQSIAKVYNGVVLGVKAGTAKITASVNDETAECSVMVRATNAYMSLNLSQTEVEIAVGNKKTILPTLVDIDGNQYPSQFVSYEFVVSDDVVSVENGVITGQKVGQTEVTVKAVCASKTVYEKIKAIVKEDVNLSFSKTVVNIYSNSLNGQKTTSEQLVAYVYENGQKVENPNLTYEIRDLEIATVTNNGIVSGLTKGQTVVTASYESKQGTIVTADIDINVEYAEVLLSQSLSLEVYADKNDTLDLSEYAGYFATQMSDISIIDDLGNYAFATISNGVVTIENNTLSYGFRELNFIVNGQVKFTIDAEIVTKYIKTADQLANFAVEYGHRDENGCYEGYFVLANDIDMAGKVVDYHTGIDGSLYQVTNDSIGFKGLFDGKGYTICNAEHNIFGRVSKDGVIKNVAFYSDFSIESGHVASVFAGVLENVYIHSNLSQTAKSHHSSICYRTIGNALIKNVVVEVVDMNDVAETTLIYDTIAFPPTVEKVFVITPSLDDAIVYPSGKVNGEVIHYTLDQVDKDFSTLDKSSGYWQMDSNKFKFLTTAIFDLEMLATPDKSTFSVDENGTLTWTAVENADGYKLLINGTTLVETATNSYPNFNEGVVKIMAKGNGITYRNSAYCEPFICLNPAKGYLADFSYEGYESTVRAAKTPHGTPTVNAEYMEEYQGEQNVLKISGSLSGSYFSFRIDLPRSATKKVAFKMYIEYNGAMGMLLGDPDTSETGSTEEYGQIVTAVKNDWSIYNFDYTNYTTKNVLEISTWANNTAPIIYISYVEDVDLANMLEEGYLADFSSELYEGFVSQYTASNGIVCYAPTATYLESYQGETNVLKIEMKSLDNTRAGFKLKLPKVADGNIIVKLYVETSGGVGMTFQNPDDNVAMTGDVASSAKGKWAEQTLDYSTVNKNDEIWAYVWTNPGLINVNVYLSWVKTA